MVKAISERVLKDIAQANQGRWFFPPDPGTENIRLNERPLSAGFFLMWGPTGGGKSTMALSLALILGAEKGALNFAYVLEPRATGNYNKLLEDSGLAYERTLKMFEDYRSSEAPYLVVDSFTHLISSVGTTLLGTQEDVTMEKGLKKSDILGVLALDHAARERSLTIIGTVNSELFPRPRVLEGACEGMFELSGEGTLTLRDRANRRDTTFKVPTEVIGVARELLGQRGEASYDSVKGIWI